MTSKLLFLLFFCSLTLIAQKLPPREFGRYEGYYVFDVKQGDPFENFAQFELHVITLKDSSLRLQGKVIFYTDTDTTQNDTNLRCATTFRKFFITKDSLFFETQKCFGETYEFKGHFLGVPSDFEGKEDDPILEGTMVFRKNKKIIKDGPVKFLWSVGC
jgi:hypothetical protein